MSNKSGRGAETRKARYTPGPWKFESFEHEGGDIYIQDSKGETLARVWLDDACKEPNPKQYANAALIASAPAMLEALKGLIACDLMRNLIGGYQYQIEQAEKAISQAEAV